MENISTPDDVARNQVRISVDADTCPDCKHPWRSHQGRNGGEKCVYRAYGGYVCPCRRMDPAVEAEDRAAGAAWRAFMGYEERS